MSLCFNLYTFSILFINRVYFWYTMTRQDATMEKTPLVKIQHEIEILLSNDFDAMSLTQLKETGKEIGNLFSISRKEHGVGELRLSNSQNDSHKYLNFLIKKLENQNDSVKVGDLFYSSWGYDQTNIEFFKVVGLTKSGKSAKVRQIGSKTKEGSEGFMSDSAFPDPDFEVDLPDLTLKIERSTEWHPRLCERHAIGEITLRGSVYYGTSGHNQKHLQNIYRIQKDQSIGRSWYA